MRFRILGLPLTYIHILRTWAAIHLQQNPFEPKASLHKQLDPSGLWPRV